LIVEDGIVVDAAPYVRRRTMGRDARQVWDQLTREGGKLVWIPDDPR